MADKQGEINRAQKEEPRVAKGRPSHGSPGPEKHYNKAAFSDAGKKEGAALGRAVNELHEQHPKKHDERGPHHGGSTHDRHEPLHGLHPKSRHGR
jgi:hypothetical protein